jgi:DNA-binding NarL/FixJ family response regulator
MSPIPVLVITCDDQLWQHWCGLGIDRWLPARGRSLMDLRRWREQGRVLAVLDSLMPGLPSLGDPVWESTLSGLDVVVVSSMPNDEQATQALRAGAHGYCHGYANLQALSQTLEVVSGGGIWMGRTLVARLLKLVGDRLQGAQQWQVNNLTEREAAVARCAANGESNAEISKALGITERTVKARLSAAFEKMGVTDRLHLALVFHGISPARVPVSNVR